MKHYIYFDKEALPQQASKAITNMAFNINFTEIFFKHLGVSLDYLYQNTSQPEVIRIPQNTASAKLFFSAVPRRIICICT